MQAVPKSLPALLLALSFTAGCEMTGTITSESGGTSPDDTQDTRSGDDDPTPPPASCKTLDFDHVAPGTALTDAYAAEGITVNVYQGGTDDPGLPVAFDSNNPTGGDDDLAYTGLNNLLISQECPTDDEIAAGFVDEPDDDARGAKFELVFDDPVCVTMLTLLDIDLGEADAKIRLYDADDNILLTQLEPPMGNNERQDVALHPTDACNVSRMTIKISSSGAVDNVEICEEGGAGEIVWTDTFEGTPDGTEVGNGIASDADGNIYVAGEYNAGGGADGIVLKLDPDGTEIWRRTFGDAGNDVATSVATGPGGSAYVGGYDGNGADLDAVVLEYLPNGDLGMTHRFATANDELINSVAVDPDGDILAAGQAGANLWVRKLAPDGAELWTVDTLGTGTLRSVATDADGNVYVAGDVVGAADLDLYIAKLSADGALLWDDTLDLGPSDTAGGVAVSSAGTVLLNGAALNADGEFDIVFQAYEPDGTRSWTDDFEGGVADFATGATADAAGDFVSVGFTVTATGVDIFLRKHAPDGTRLWTRLIDEGPSDVGNAVATDSDRNVLATGSSFDTTNDDLWVGKLTP